MSLHIMTDDVREKITVQYIHENSALKKALLDYTRSLTLQRYSGPRPTSPEGSAFQPLQYRLPVAPDFQYTRPLQPESIHGALKGRFLFFVILNARPDEFGNLFFGVHIGRFAFAASLKSNLTLGRIAIRVDQISENKPQAEVKWQRGSEHSRQRSARR